MTREEIREGITKKIQLGIDFGFLSTQIAKEVLEYLHSQGVVIKKEEHRIYTGYYQIEPLIEESK